MKNKPVDFNLLLFTMLLVAIGLVMVFSASSVMAMFRMNDSYYFLKRQFLWATMGFFAMVYMMNFDYHYLEKYKRHLFVISIILLGLVFVPGIGINIKGASRWIGYGNLSIQPSEIAKIALIVCLASNISQKQDRIKSFFKGVVPNLIIVGIFFVLIALEPNMSTAGIIAIVGLVIIYVGGAKLSNILSLIGLGGVLGGIMIFAEQYRMNRVLAFLDPWKDMQGKGYQVVQSLYALGSGGIFGVGLGRSRQKLFYIPEPQNDFIFSILGEELGFIGALFVITLFLLFIIRGLRIAAKAPDLFGCLLAVGITSLIGVQFLLNIAVVTASMPPTGVPLPFISYGGSSLVFTMAQVGILLNISRYADSDKG
ncbi:cell division protein FtsW [Caldanaerobius fijiensis DSM 17918]|uniref:Probable peptidoglycan glycosyltransferase FtsW n=1 Tax=Caldanaerobius fijiensis DSM 17918 TaxID=1121256 RepID=A0A1M4T2B6_9THEO|nr:stage V sporulation protein E [Caldanaerobius fijiensis]SHE38593.1 cell division protein FtsW [Caldanaerobius fijiensis DSM 17918]